MDRDSTPTIPPTSSNMDEECNVFERSVNSKLSDWTSVFDSNADLEHYKFCWSPNESPGSRSPEIRRSKDSLLSESVVFEKVSERLSCLWSMFLMFSF